MGDHEFLSENPPLVVHGDALNQILRQARVGPSAELRAAGAPHAEADGENRLEVVVLDLAGDRAMAFGSNYPEWPDGCRAAQLSLVEDVHEVFVDGAHRTI